MLGLAYWNIRFDEINIVIYSKLDIFGWNWNNFFLSAALFCIIVLMEGDGTDTFGHWLHEVDDAASVEFLLVLLRAANYPPPPVQLMLVWERTWHAWVINKVFEHSRFTNQPTLFHLVRSPWLPEPSLCLRWSASSPSPLGPRAASWRGRTTRVSRCCRWGRYRTTAIRAYNRTHDWGRPIS